MAGGSVQVHICADLKVEPVFQVSSRILMQSNDLAMLLTGVMDTQNWAAMETQAGLPLGYGVDKCIFRCKVWTRDEFMHLRAKDA